MPDLLPSCQAVSGSWLSRRFLLPFRLVISAYGSHPCPGFWRTSFTALCPPHRLTLLSAFHMLLTLGYSPQCHSKMWNSITPVSGGGRSSRLEGFMAGHTVNISSERKVTLGFRNGRLHVLQIHIQWAESTRPRKFQTVSLPSRIVMRLEKKTL
jgi:hypothetical protein